MKALKPLKDIVILSAVKSDEKMAGGLLFKPLTIDDDITEGKVVAVGRGYLTQAGQIVPLEVKEGDTVLFHKSSAVEIKFHGETFYRLREEQIVSGVK